MELPKLPSAWTPSLPTVETTPTSFGRQVSTGKRPQVRVGGSFLHNSAEGTGPVSCKSRFEAVMTSMYLANFMAVVVLVDAISTCADIDATAADEATPPIFQTISDMCLVCYTCEALGLFGLYGRPLFKDWMMILDVVIVLCGWGEKILAAVNFSSFGFRISVLRALRLVRIFRLMRLLKRIRPLRELHKLVMMMATCLRTLIWSFMLCFVVMTVWAMLMVEIVHPTLLEMYQQNKFTDCDEHCLRSMSSVMDANLLLFKTVIAGDSWGQIAVPVIREHPATAIIFVGSLLTLVFGVLNLIVAVVVDTFADARLNDVQNLAEEMEDEIEHDRKALAKLFARIDEDGSGQLTLTEMIEGARRDPGFQSRLRVMDIDEQDLEQLFQMIDRDQSGTIEVAEFIGPLSRWAHDSKTAPRFIKYHMLQTMQMQEDLWDLSVECFGQLNNRIEELSKRWLGQAAGEHEAAPAGRRFSHHSATSATESCYETAGHTGDSSVMETTHTIELSRVHSRDSPGMTMESRPSDGSQMSRVSPQDFSLLQGGVSTFHGVDQPRSSAHADFLAAKTEDRQRHEESLVVLGLLEAATAKLESRMESFLAEIRSPTQDHAMAPAEAILAKKKVKSKKKGNILHPEAFRNMYMDRGRRLFQPQDATSNSPHNAVHARSHHAADDAPAPSNAAKYKSKSDAARSRDSDDSFPRI